MNATITGAYSKTDDILVIRVEVTFTNFIVENNLPIALVDQVGKLFHLHISRNDLELYFRICQIS